MTAPSLSAFRRLRASLALSGGPRRGRIVLAMAAFALVYGAICVRLVLLGFAGPEEGTALLAPRQVTIARPDILDRNGEVLATDIKTYTLIAEPKNVVDPDEAVEAIGAIFPDLRDRSVRRRLAGKASYTVLKRAITPEQRDAIHRLGLPGIGFEEERKRFYPMGPIAAHVVGYVDVDNVGRAGIERFIDQQGLADLAKLGVASDRGLEPRRLSLDLRVQHVLRDELALAMQRYRAVAAIGIVLDVATGEVVGMSSLPDYDPNDPTQALDKDRLNRATGGAFEMGSVFKAFNTAMALDSGKVRIGDSFDARGGIEIGGFRISDFHGKNRVLTVPEIFIYSSNVGSARMALRVGGEGQKAFLARTGMLSRLPGELPETALPLAPRRWADLTTATISFGHGISVTPMHTAVAAAALVNGGRLIPPTFLPRPPQEANAVATQIIKPETSARMRELFRLNAEKGSGKRADVPGYLVGGKTGTAEKVENGRYSSHKRFNSFLAAFPMDAPRYVVLVVLDEPKPEKDGEEATAARNAAPTVAAVVRRIAPILGIPPRPDAAKPAVASN